MEITRKSAFTGRVRTRTLQVTHEQLAQWEAGELIQVAMPQLTDDEREFLQTGATQEEWDAMFKEAG